MSHPVIKRALEYWSDRRREQGLPRRRDIDPVHIPRLLPYLAILDVHHEPLDFTFRLAGEQLILSYGSDLRGRSVHEIVEAEPGFEPWFSAIEISVVSEAPHFRESRLATRAGGPVAIEAAAMPLHDGEGTVAHVLFACVVLDR